MNDQDAIARARALGARITQARNGSWQWCRTLGADSVYGGFETEAAAARDFLASQRRNS